MIRFLQTPGPVKKIIFGGLLVLLSLAMLVYLIPSGGPMGNGTTQRGVLAEVGGANVTTTEVQRAARNIIEQQYPRGGPQVAYLMPLANRQAAEQLIYHLAMDAEARRQRQNVIDQELRHELLHGYYFDTFFPGGKFIGKDA